jgi:hypothetical protein
MIRYCVVLRRFSARGIEHAEIIRQVRGGSTAYEAILAALEVHKGWIAAGVEVCALTGQARIIATKSKGVDTEHVMCELDD